MSEERAPAPEAAAAVVLAAVVLAFFVPVWARGLTPFWGDLTYLHQAWRASPAQLIQAGRAPLWEPSLYLGMPMAASQQGGLFYPPTQAFYFFGFAAATALFEALHLFLAGWLTALWLRSLRVSWGAAVAGGVSFAFGGLMVSRLPFLNHLAVLSWAPALPLLFRRRAALAAALALMFLAGYPTFLPGACAAAWAVALALRSRRGPGTGPAAWAVDWTAAGALALALSAVQLLPALELAALSRRSGGVGAAEALTWSFALADLRQWVSPLFVPLSAFHPEVDWWKCVYLGVVASCAAGLGLWRLPRRRAAALGAALVVVAVLILGGSNPLSRALWERFPPLRYVRYPGNLSYLALLPLTALVGAGFARASRAPLLAVLAAAELLVFARVATPTAPRTLFTEPGPVVRALRPRLDGTRYLISPRALEAASGFGLVDWKTRLYGLTNAPYRLRAVANFGEPLVPETNYAFMDRVLSAPNVDAAASWMAWAGASRLLTPAPASSPLLVPEERPSWHLSRLSGPVALAYLMTPAAGGALPPGLPDAAPALGRPLAVARVREDRFAVSGEGAGWAFVAEPRYPGWTATLETPRGAGAVAPLPALGPFQKVSVPDGPWRLSFRYDPASWRLGVLLSLASLLAFGSYWYHRASRLSHVP
ncbi:MAG: hypothetical protein HY079_08670 [Elusimicrobia bacterium]|nr:hypothetical protein [Elusimicrobiota bacterium]